MQTYEARTTLRQAIVAIRASRIVRPEKPMTEAVDKIARRLAPLVQEGVIGGYTVREVSQDRMLVTVSPRPKSPLPIGKVREQVLAAVLDVDGVIVEFLP